MLVENTNTRLKSALLGQNSGIFSFAIGTAENPMGKPLSKADNLVLRKKFETLLKDGGFKYTPIIGKYGNLEKSYIIYNIDLSFAKKIFGEYFNQESFVWAKKVSAGVMEFEYWQKDENSKYELINKQNHITTEKDADDFFSRLKSYKFKIPFEFEESDIDFFDHLNNLNEEDKVFLSEYVNGNRVGYSSYLRRLYINSKK